METERAAGTRGPWPARGPQPRGWLAWLWGQVLSWRGAPGRAQPGGAQTEPAWAHCPGALPPPAGPCPLKRPVLLWNASLAGRGLPGAPATPQRSNGTVSCPRALAGRAPRPEPGPAGKGQRQQCGDRGGTTQGRGLGAAGVLREPPAVPLPSWHCRVPPGGPWGQGGGRAAGPCPREVLYLHLPKTAPREPERPWPRCQ